MVTCGKCDNCARDPETVVTRDVTLDSWRILQIVKAVQKEGGRVTLANLADLVRGLGKGSFAIPSDGSSRKRKAEAEQGQLDVNSVAGGKVELNKEVRFGSGGWTDFQDTEALLIHLTLLGYLADCEYMQHWTCSGPS